MENTQDQDFDYFLQNVGSFYKRYGHKFLAVKNKAVLGVYDSFDTAIYETLKSELLGTFIIQECFRNKEESVISVQCLKCLETNLVGEKELNAYQTYVELVSYKNFVLKGWEDGIVYDDYAARDFTFPLDICVR
jgi:hypothetical protein